MARTTIEQQLIDIRNQVMDMLNAYLVYGPQEFQLQIDHLVLQVERLEEINQAIMKGD